MDVLHCHLEPIETSGFWNLDLGTKLLRQVLHHNAVAGGKKGKNVLDEMFLLFIQSLPVSGIG